MKIMLLALLFPVFCHAQNEKANAVSQDSIPNTSFYLKETRIIYQKVFKSNLSQKELADQVYRLLSTTKDFKFDIDGVGNVDFYGRLCLHQFDNVRYNTTVFNAPVLLNIPIDATVVVQVKDNRYRVTISDITFKYTTDLLLDNELTERNRSRLNLGRSSLKLAKFLDQDFTDLFEIKNLAISSDF
jgi:hypothetical protein